MRFVDFVKDIDEVDFWIGGGYLYFVLCCFGDESKVVMMKKLLERGLEVNGRDNNDDILFYLMVIIVDCVLMRFLVENGVDFFVKNWLGEIVLYLFVFSNELDGF